LLIVSLPTHTIPTLTITMDEKLSLISDLIKLAKADGEISEKEYEFLLTMSRIIGIDEYEFNKIFSKDVKFTPPLNEQERIVQFYRLVLLANIDLNVDSQEINYLKQSGLQLGLNLFSIETVLQEMKKNKNGKIPSERLIEIFKINHN